MSYAGKGYSDSSQQSTGVEGSSHLKLYQAFIFSVPVLFAFLLLVFFYIFYLRRRRVDWSSLRMRSPQLPEADVLSRCELGLKKEVRERLPIIVFHESLSVKDTQCSVCLGDYEADDRLQQIPVCGHVFHMDCIDNWLATHSTCPLCRQSLLTPPKPETPHTMPETSDTTSPLQGGDETSRPNGDCPKVGVEPRTTDERVIQPDESEGDNVDREKGLRDEKPDSV